MKMLLIAQHLGIMHKRKYPLNVKVVIIMNEEKVGLM